MPRRTTTSAPSRRGAASDAGRILSSVRDLVAENAALKRELAELRSFVDSIQKTLGSTRGTDNEGDVTPRRRGRPPKVRDTPARARRKITDPAILEKRREALTKARAARAANIAARRGD